jgi:hypothetical protein
MLTIVDKLSELLALVVEFVLESLAGAMELCPN